MSFTITGVFIIIIGVFLFLFSNKWLFAATVFFIPFTATAIVNIGDPTNGSSIQPYMYLSILFIIKNSPILGKKLLYDSWQIEKLRRYFLIAFCLFIATVAISLVMPILINGSIQGNISGKLGEILPITFSSKNLTQFLYFILGVLFSFFSAYYLSKKDNLFFAIKVFSYSILFVIVWGLMEYTLKKLSLPYPAIIFNNSSNSAISGFNGVLENGTIRIFSVTAEPSVLSQNILVFLPFLLVGLEKKIYIFSKVVNILFIALICIFILLSTSASGIISVVAMMLLFILTKKQSLKKLIVSILQVIIGLTIVIPISYFLFKDIIDSALINKSDSYSALERLGTITSGWDNFFASPILGVGWGSVTVNDFFLRILVNSGIFAFIFIIIAIIILIRLHNKLPDPENIDALSSYLNRSILLSFVILLFNCEISGFSFYFGIFWLIFGFTIVDKFKLKYENTNDNRQLST